MKKISTPITMAEFQKGLSDAKKIVNRKILFWGLATGVAMGMTFNAYQQKGVMLGFDSGDEARRAMAKQMGVQLTD